GLPKVARRFVGEMLYGIQASQSVVLTRIGRRLEEEISIKKVQERLGRQLMREELGPVVQRNLLKMAGGLVRRDTLVVLDITDIRKRYAQKMEYLAGVRDGSEGEIGRGYWLLKVVATEVEGEGMVPLVGRLYSSEAPGHVSENAEMLDTMEMVAGAVKKRGIWVLDRGGDRRNLLEPMLERGYRFLIRLLGSRHLMLGRDRACARDIAGECPCPYRETVVKMEEGKEKVYHLEFGFRHIRLPGRPEVLGLIVVKGFGQEPMMLLTTEPLRKSRKVLWRLIRAYLRRWAIEETIRFIKQSYDIEDVRVLGYKSLRNLMALVVAASYFAAVVLDTGAKLRVMAGHILKAAKRVFGIPDFHYYAIADGLMSIFMRYPGRIFRPSPGNLEQRPLFISDA
ncbi:MAG: transposase, partial [Anaerolineae bacterium]